MVVGWLCCCRCFFFLCFCFFSVFLLLFLTVQGCFNDGEDGAVVAEERKHSGGAQVVRNNPSSPLCSDPPVSVLLFFPKVFLLCFVLLASVFLFLHSARSRFPLCHCPSLLLQNFAPSGFPFFRFCILPVFPCSFLFFLFCPSSSPLKQTLPSVFCPKIIPPVL